MPTTTIIPRIRLRNAAAWAPQGASRWFAAALAFVVALLIRMILHDFLGGRFPLIVFSIATLAIHFFYGLGPAIAIALVSLPVADYLFVPPYLEFELPNEDDLLLITYYIGTTVLFMVLVQYLRRAQYQSVLLAEIAESRYLMLLDSESDRAAAEAEMQRRDA